MTNGEAALVRKENEAGPVVLKKDGEVDRFGTEVALAKVAGVTEKIEKIPGGAEVLVSDEVEAERAEMIDAEAAVETIGGEAAVEKKDGEAVVEMIGVRTETKEGAAAREEALAKREEVLVGEKAEALSRSGCLVG